MADQLPINFAIPTENVQATYDYQDIADGTGIVEIYALKTEQGYILNKNQLYSTINGIDLGYVVSSSTSDYTKYIDQDFDLSAFNTQRVIKGTAYISFGAYLIAGNSGEYQAYFNFILKKWDGSTETTIGSGNMSGFDVVGAGTVKKGIVLTKFDLTETTLGIGDVLRLTVEGYSKREGATGGACTFAIGTDPMNRDGTHIIPSTDSPVTTTVLKAYVPFKIDI